MLYRKRRYNSGNKGGIITRDAVITRDDQCITDDFDFAKKMFPY